MRAKHVVPLWGGSQPFAALATLGMLGEGMDSGIACRETSGEGCSLPCRLPPAAVGTAATAACAFCLLPPCSLGLDEFGDDEVVEANPWGDEEDQDLGDAEGARPGGGCCGPPES